MARPDPLIALSLWLENHPMIPTVSAGDPSPPPVPAPAGRFRAASLREVVIETGTLSDLDIEPGDTIYYTTEPIGKHSTDWFVGRLIVARTCCCGIAVGTYETDPDRVELHDGSDDWVPFTPQTRIEGVVVHVRRDLRRGFGRYGPGDTFK